jgi:hypothetical protein
MDIDTIRERMRRGADLVTTQEPEMLTTQEREDASLYLYGALLETALDLGQAAEYVARLEGISVEELDAVASVIEESGAAGDEPT